MGKTKVTKQLFEWAGEMGKKYTDRNPQSPEEFDRLYLKDYDVSRTAMNEEFLADIPRDLKILEVGANIGVQLEFLRRMGFTNLTGLEINEYAVSQAKKLHPEVEVILGSGFDVPFSDGAFDLVYTSGVLIHISPDDIKSIISEMHRVSSHYIWGFEYYSPEYTEVTYRGTSDLLWKADFCGLFADTFADLKVVKERKYRMTDEKNVSQMYLLEKRR
ncbi:methyltransferase type 11 [Candidatus Kaiserbacteria bacterium CG10_big_fil_rev_8_21_14_0_10_59_10]|uniref:Methyltransferase type 11 n=1 Tax=Candidatus Kaiserbacteria bacterium CG10_big_fil_rev_8_21_14_0_10_59_10 TaxID=1974612 RepID=A0A2H0U7R3_9BACT|nr:MAG: methyltransferase type 11 [Candidatus Kaiserbacteria bacterium CG10_big_fil_rev_8_21_14_0_10_59_10]